MVHDRNNGANARHAANGDDGDNFHNDRCPGLRVGFAPGVLRRAAVAYDEVIHARP